MNNVIAEIAAERARVVDLARQAQGAAREALERNVQLLRDRILERQAMELERRRLRQAVRDWSSIAFVAGCLVGFIVAWCV